MLQEIGTLGCSPCPTATDVFSKTDRGIASGIPWSSCHQLSQVDPVLNLQKHHAQVMKLLHPAFVGRCPRGRRQKCIQTPARQSDGNVPSSKQKSWGYIAAEGNYAFYEMIFNLTAWLLTSISALWRKQRNFFRFTQR